MQTGSLHLIGVDRAVRRRRCRDVTVSAGNGPKKGKTLLVWIPLIIFSAEVFQKSSFDYHHPPPTKILHHIMSSFESSCFVFN